MCWSVELIIWGYAVSMKGWHSQPNPTPSPCCAFSGPEAWMGLDCSFRLLQCPSMSVLSSVTLTQNLRIISFTRNTRTALRLQLWSRGYLQRFWGMGSCKQIRPRVKRIPYTPCATQQFVWGLSTVRVRWISLTLQRMPERLLIRLNGFMLGSYRCPKRWRRTCRALGNKIT